MIPTILLLLSFQTPETIASSPAQRFQAYAQQEAARQLSISPAQANALRIEVLDFRESSLFHNITGSVGGMFSNDPGHYILTLRFENSSGPQCFRLENSVTLRALLFGNAFSRQAMMRQSLRRQLRQIARLPAGHANSCPTP